MSSTDLNKRIVRRLYEEVVGAQRYELIESLIAPDAYDHNARTRGWGEGISGFRRHARHLSEVFPGFVLSVDDLVAEDDRVIAFWHFRGTHGAPLWGVPATGRQVEAHTISLIRLREGKVIEYESRPDRLGLLAQLGSLGEYASSFTGTSQAGAER